jgi:hypothetical protein
LASVHLGRSKRREWRRKAGAVYEGELQGAAFLVSLLEAAGIATNLGRPVYALPARIHVVARDVEAVGDCR